MPKRVPMASIDAAWLGMEDPTNLMMVTGVLALAGPVDRRRLRLLLDRRLKPFGRFHQRVVRPRSRGNLPHWEDDEHFEIANHLSYVALPAPGGDKQLRDLVSDLMSAPLDFSKPLWHMHVIDRYGGGSVVLARVHHSIADGIALVRVMLSLTDESPNPRPARAPQRGAASGFRLPLEWLPAALGRGLVAGTELIANPGRTLDIARTGAQGAYRLARLVLLPPDPATVFKGQLGRSRFLSTTSRPSARLSGRLSTTCSSPPPRGRCGATSNSAAGAPPGSRFAPRCPSTSGRPPRRTRWATHSALCSSPCRSGSLIRREGCAPSRGRWTSSRFRPRRWSRSGC